MSPQARCRAVTLDASGTLIHPAEPVGVTYARFAAASGFATSAGEIDARFRVAFAAAEPLAFPDVPAADIPSREREWWRGIVFEALGRPTRDIRFDACSTALFDHYARACAWQVYSEVPDVLATLRARGFRLAVVSNFDGRLGPLLSALGVAPLIDAIIHSTGVGHAKPDPRILHAAAAALGVEEPALLHVGDAPEDVIAARAAGARVVRLDRSGMTATPPDRIDSLGRLLDHPFLAMPQP